MKDRLFDQSRNLSLEMIRHRPFLDDEFYHRIYLLCIFNIIISPDEETLNFLYQIIDEKSFHEKMRCLIENIDQEMKKKVLSNCYFSLLLQRLCGLEQSCFETQYDLLEQESLKLDPDSHRSFLLSIDLTRKLFFPHFSSSFEDMRLYEAKFTYVENLFQSIESDLKRAQQLNENDPQSSWNAFDLIIKNLASYPLEGFQKAKIERKITMIQNQRFQEMLKKAGTFFVIKKDDEKAQKFYDVIFDMVAAQGFTPQYPLMYQDAYPAFFFYAKGLNDKALKWADYVLSRADLTQETHFLTQEQLTPITGVYFLYTWMNDLGGKEKLEIVREKILSPESQSSQDLIESIKRKCIDEIKGQEESKRAQIEAELKRQQCIAELLAEESQVPLSLKTALAEK